MRVSIGEEMDEKIALSSVANSLLFFSVRYNALRSVFYRRPLFDDAATKIKLIAASFRIRIICCYVPVKQAALLVTEAATGTRKHTH